MSDPRTDLDYNGIVLRNVLTRAFDQEAVYDDSGTDLLYHKVRIRVSAYVHDVLGLGPNAPGVYPQSGSDINVIYKYIKQRLMSPRQYLLYSVGSSPLLELFGAANNQNVPGNEDVNNGPKPKSCDIVHVAGDNVFRIEYEIECAFVDCDNDQNSAGVLSNRWSMSDDIDQDWYTTRSIHGRLRVASINLNPQSFRGWVVPPLQKGFKRESMSFVTTPDGLNLDYSITDKQVYAACPFPGTTWAATHRELTNDGVTGCSELAMTITGPPGVNKMALIQLGAQLVEAKLGVRNGQAAREGRRLESAAITDHLNASTIEFHVRTRSTKEQTSWYFQTAGDQLGKPVDGDMIDGYDQFTSPVPSDVDLASPTVLFICYLQNPCNDQHSVQNVIDDNESPGVKGYRKSTQITTSTGSFPSAGKSGWSSDQMRAMYTTYEIDTNYGVDDMSLALPVATAPSSGDGSQRPSRAIINLAPPQATLTLNVTAERFTEWPMVQEPVPWLDHPTGPAKRVSAVIVSQAARLSVDGTSRTYVIKQQIVYSLARMPNPNEYISAVMPYMQSQPADSLIPSQAMSGQLMSRG